MRTTESLKKKSIPTPEPSQDLSKSLRDKRQAESKQLRIISEKLVTIYENGGGKCVFNLGVKQLPWEALPELLASAGHYFSGWPEMCLPLQDPKKANTIDIEYRIQKWTSAQRKAMEDALNKDQVKLLPRPPGRAVLFETISPAGLIKDSVCGMTSTWIETNLTHSSPSPPSSDSSLPEIIEHPSAAKKPTSSDAVQKPPSTSNSARKQSPSVWASPPGSTWKEGVVPTGTTTTGDSVIDLAPRPFLVPPSMTPTPSQPEPSTVDEAPTIGPAPAPTPAVPDEAPTAKVVISTDPEPVQHAGSKRQAPSDAPSSPSKRQTLDTGKPSSKSISSISDNSTATTSSYASFPHPTPAKTSASTSRSTPPTPTPNPLPKTTPTTTPTSKLSLNRPGSFTSLSSPDKPPTYKSTPTHIPLPHLSSKITWVNFKALWEFTLKNTTNQKISLFDYDDNLHWPERQPERERVFWNPDKGWWETGVGKGDSKAVWNRKWGMWELPALYIYCLDSPNGRLSRLPNHSLTNISGPILWNETPHSNPPNPSSTTIPNGVAAKSPTWTIFIDDNEKNEALLPLWPAVIEWNQELWRWELRKKVEESPFLSSAAAAADKPGEEHPVQDAMDVDGSPSVEKEVVMNVEESAATEEDPYSSSDDDEPCIFWSRDEGVWALEFPSSSD